MVKLCASLSSCKVKPLFTDSFMKLMLALLHNHAEKTFMYMHVLKLCE